MTDGFWDRMPVRRGMYWGVTVSQRWSSVMMMTTFGEDTACAAVVGAIRAATSPRGTAHLQHRRT
ncbi:MAG TPA: hypothetical protein VHN56_04275, partial [Actinomycetota bacterium]|nr:hypothetical protein [Actinomycetota bacterium]